jgi:alkylated DNA repair dioxygenase AlkB
MDLFNTQPITNILPFDGEAIYFGKILNVDQAQQVFQTLLNEVAWKNDEVMIYGKHIITKRKVAWYGDTEYSYTYSNTTKQAQIWTPELLKLKNVVEELSGNHFNSCLLNLYHNGSEGMSWHSDDEKDMEKNSAIASLTLGAERKFSFKHRSTKLTLSILLESGSLLVMKGTTQSYWLHSLPKTTKVLRPRINLTFRNIVV